jgi:heptosyltransferase-1
MRARINDGDKILIIKLGSIGDVIHTLPALVALRTQFRQSYIAWLIEQGSSDLIKDHPLLDKVFIFQRTMRHVWPTVRQIREERFQWAIDFQGTYKSQFFSLLSRGQYRVGYDKVREYFPFTYNIKIPLSTLEKHAVDRNIELIEAIGGNLQEIIEFPIPINDHEKQKVTSLLATKHIQEYCAVSATAGKQANQWEPLKFSKLADNIAKRWNLSVIFIGHQNDYAINQKIISATHRKSIVNFAGVFTLKETAYLLSQAKFIICGDTGPMHLGVAMECPVIALFGGSNPQRTGPYQGKSMIIQYPIACSPCYKRQCLDNVCLRNITVEEVINACQSMLNL